MSKHKRHFHKKRNFNHKKEFHNYSSGCNYCGKHIDGLPHRCKYCGTVHCDDHLLPEDHNCQGLERPKTFPIKQISSRGDYEDFTPSYSSPTWGNKQYRNNYHSTPKKHFHFPRFSFPRIRINSFFKSLILILISYFLAINFRGNVLFLWIEFLASVYFATIVFKGVFRWANRVSMADDLAFFGLRILGAVVAFISIYLFFAVGLASILVKNSAPESIPLYTLVAGLFFLGAFIAFRTNRRHHVVGMWNAN